jgi:hypothetical protein
MINFAHCNSLIALRQIASTYWEIAENFTNQVKVLANMTSAEADL